MEANLLSWNEKRERRPGMDARLLEERGAAWTRE